MNKELICKTGRIEFLSDTIVISNTKGGNQELLKKNVIISFEDGQKGIFEARRGEIKHIENSNIGVGDIVEIHFALKLSETKSKTFNNLRIFRIFKKDE